MGSVFMMVLLMLLLLPSAGLRKSRYEGTNQGTKGTILNETLLLLPRFPHKNVIFRVGTHFELLEKSNNSKLKIQNRSKLDQNGPKGV